MMMASEAAARVTSVSEMAPTALWIIKILTSGLVDLGKGVGQGLDGALDVGRDHEVELLDLGLVHGLEEVLEGDVLLALLLGLTALEGALVGKLAGLALVGEHAELVAGVGHRVQARLSTASEGPTSFMR